MCGRRVHEFNDVFKVTLERGTLKRINIVLNYSKQFPPLTLNGARKIGIIPLHFDIQRRYQRKKNFLYL